MSNNKLYIVIDERGVEGEENQSALVGVFTKPELANRAISRVQAHWKKFDGGAEEECHTVSHFEFNGVLDRATMPVYEDSVGEEEGDEEDEELEEDDDDIEDDDSEEEDEDDDDDEEDEEEDEDDE